MKQFQKILDAYLAKYIQKKIILAFAINGLTMNALGQSDTLKEKTFPPDFNQQAEDALKPKTAREDLKDTSKSNIEESKIQDDLKRKISQNQNLDKKSKGKVYQSKSNETNKKLTKKKAMNSIP